MLEPTTSSGIGWSRARPARSGTRGGFLFNRYEELGVDGAFTPWTDVVLDDDFPADPERSPGDTICDTLDPVMGLNNGEDLLLPDWPSPKSIDNEVQERLSAWIPSTGGLEPQDWASPGLQHGTKGTPDD